MYNLQAKIPLWSTREDVFVRGGSFSQVSTVPVAEKSAIAEENLLYRAFRELFSSIPWRTSPLGPGNPRSGR